MSILEHWRTVAHDDLINQLKAVETRDAKAGTTYGVYPWEHLFSNSNVA
jgi:hypothetical protein